MERSFNVYAIFAFIIWAVILAICFGIGARLMKAFQVNDLTLAERIPIAVAIGMGIFAYGLLGLGLLGLVEKWAVLLLLGLLCVLAYRDVLELIARIPVSLRLWTPLNLKSLPLRLYLALLFIGTLFGALAPAGDSDYDSLVYHLTIPDLFIQHGAIHFIPWLSHSNFPFTLEMLYMFGLLWDSQALAKLFHFGCGWLTALAIFGFGRRWWGANAAKLGALIFVATPLVLWQMTTAYIELGFALYTFLMIAALARWKIRQSQTGWLFIAALLCGWALGLKMLAGILLLFGALVVGSNLWSADLRRKAFGRLVIFLVIAGAIGAPWYVKSYIWTGNPVYPFFYEVFGGRYWTAERAKLYAEAQDKFGLGRGVAEAVLLPWRLTMVPRWFFDQPEIVRPFNVHFWLFGPLLLALIPPLILLRPVGIGGQLSLLFALIFTAFWFMLTQNGRYLVPILPGLSACAGLGAARLLKRQGALGPTIKLAIILGVGAALYPAMLLGLPVVPVVAGLESQEQYLARTSTTWHTFQWVESVTPSDARIIIFGDEPRIFYLDRDRLLGDHAEIITQQDRAHPAAVLARFQQMGVTHVLAHGSAARDVWERSGELGASLNQLIAEGSLSEVGIYGSVVLWRITDE